MEKIKIGNDEYEITGITTKGDFAIITFPNATIFTGKDLSIIELYTSGGSYCTTLTGYKTVYSGDGSKEIMLSNNGSVYTEPVVPDPVEPHVPTPEEIALQLVNAKKNKIAQSKVDLDRYLNDNPLLFLDGKYYSVTKDKQNLLSNAIAVYQMKVQARDTAATIKWNAAGEECTVRPIEDVIALALSIAAYVEPLVSKQQAFEVQINACASLMELDSVVISYEAAA